MPFELIEHTADIRIRVSGDSLEHLFREAVLAMMGIVKSLQITNQYEYTNGSAGSPQEKYESTKTIQRKIVVEAPDTTALLIDFLSEVLALSQTHKEIYKEVEFIHFSPTALEAVLRGVGVNEFDEDIKAVTYHEAEVKQNEKGEWETIIVFDI